MELFNFDALSCFSGADTKYRGKIWPKVPLLGPLHSKAVSPSSIFAQRKGIGGGGKRVAFAKS